MSDKIIENNQVTIIGEIAGKFVFSHEVFGEGFYMVDVLVRRLSNSEDQIPLMISERLLDVTQDYTGEYIIDVYKRQDVDCMDVWNSTHLQLELQSWQERP